MTMKNKAVIPLSSDDADGEQPPVKNHNESISNGHGYRNLQAVRNEQVVENVEELDSHVLETTSMTELYDTVYPPKTAVVENLLYGGTYLFVGAPKVGKSFFMAQIAYHVAMGIPLWDYPVNKGTVLYLALEDDYGRLQKRLSRMFGVDASDELHFATVAETLNGGLYHQLEGFVSRYKNARLIIIDTLQKVRESGGDKYSYFNDYEIVAKLKSFSDKHHICLLVVHHTRKLESENSFDMISGTNGLLGAADGAFIMQKKKRTDNKATIDIVGRDQQDQELSVEFDREKCIWNFVKLDTELWKEPPAPMLEAVAKLFSGDVTKWSGSPTELLEALPEINLKANAFTRYLNVNYERLYNEHGIIYENKRTNKGRLVSFSQVDD